MSQPTKSDVHVNAPLTNVAVAYLQKEAAFVASQVFPVVPVAKQSDRYFKYDKAAWFRDEAKERAPSTESAGGGFDLDNTPTYYARVYAYHKDIDDQIRANADAPINLDRDATNFVTRKMLLRREMLFASTYLTTGVWGSDPVPATKWDNSSSDPIKDVANYRSTVQQSTGYEPNIMVVSEAVNIALKNNANIVDRYKHTQKGIITEDLLAAAFGVKKYLVMKAVKNTAKEGAAASMSYVFGSDAALLVYAPDAPSILEPSGGYTFSWSGLFGAGAEGVRISKFRIDAIKSDRVEGEAAYDLKLVAPDVGVYINDVLT